MALLGDFGQIASFPGPQLPGLSNEGIVLDVDLDLDLDRCPLQFGHHRIHDFAPQGGT